MKRILNILHKFYVIHGRIKENSVKISSESDENCKNYVARRFKKKKRCFEKNATKAFENDSFFAKLKIFILPSVRDMPAS